MKNVRLDKALESFRNELIDIIKEELVKVGGKKDIKLEFANDFDEDRCFIVTINAIFIEDGEVFVQATEGLYDEEYNEELTLYSCDQIIEVARQLLS